VENYRLNNARLRLGLPAPGTKQFSPQAHAILNHSKGVLQ